jgi:hypothetical protein
MSDRIEGLKLRPVHFEVAAEILSSQPFVPKSPGLRKDRKNLLCAGAALVAAVLEIELSLEDRNLFEGAILAEDGKQVCLSSLRYVGGDDIAVANVLIANDECEDSERKVAMVCLLSSFADRYRQD